MYKIGFIDENAGQRNQFFNAFKDDFEVTVIEPTENDNEEELLRKILETPLDLLVIDYRMDELLDFNGDSIARKLKELNPNLPIIILTSHRTEALENVDDFRMVYDKEIWDDPDSEKFESFKKNLKSLMNHYEMTISKNELRLKELEEKRKEAKLDPPDEDELISLNVFFDQVFGRGPRLSRQFYTQDTNSRIDNLILRTQELLTEIKAK